MVYRKINKRINFYKPFFINLLRRHKNTGELNILIIQVAGLGDACTLMPFIKPLIKDHYNIDIVVRDGLQDLWQKFINPRQIYTFKHGKYDIKEDFYQSLENNYYDIVISTSVSPYSAFIATLPLSKNRFGMIEGNSHYKGSRIFFSRTYRAPKNEHITKRFLGLFSFIDNYNLYKIDPMPLNNVQKYKKIILHPGAKWKPRRWPKERFLVLAYMLSELGLKIKIIVHKSERDLISFFSNLDQEKDVLLIVTENVSGLIREIEKCDLFIGNDSGPAHLANLLNKSCIVLWGPGNYERIRPIGSKIYILKKEIDCRPCKQYIDKDYCQIGENKCLQMIETREVYNKAREITG